MNSQSTRPGIVVFAHGSRDPTWARPMQTVAELVRQREPRTLVACAYLELMTPSLQDCVADMVAQGVTSVRIVPLFLGTGRHVREDLPGLIEPLHKNHPSVRFELLPTIGEDERVLQLMADIALGRA